MDNVTHALAGCLLAETANVLLEKRGVAVTSRVRNALFAVGIISAELPDADLLYSGNVLGMGKLGYLLHHRGYTHTVLFAIVGALLVWWGALALRNELKDATLNRPVLLLAYVGTFSHLLLDYTNSYGVHPFWPIVNKWYYGDAVFILEPWLMIAALPPLFLLARGKIAKGVYALTLAAIIVAAWMIGFVGKDVAIALTVATPLWFLASRMVKPSRQVVLAVTAWLVVELVFFSASGIARREVMTAIKDPATLRDIVLTPAVGNPLCYNAIAVEVAGDVYAATSAAVATVPAIRTSLHCDTAAGVSPNSPVPAGAFDPTSLAITHQSSLSVAWGAQRRGSRVALIALVQENCEISAALSFVRVPAWRDASNGGTEFSDLRFGEGDFASIVTSSKPTKCPRFVPRWTPPRLDLFTRP